MIRNYITTAWRNFIKHRNISVINVIGLAIGMACVAIIALYIQDELKFDQFHQNKERIYRIVTEYGEQGETDFHAVSSYPLPEALSSQFAEIESISRIRLRYEDVFHQGADRFKERVVYAVDSTFLDIFSFGLLYGDVKTALENPDGVVLSQQAAQKYFGGTDIIGETLSLDLTEGDMTFHVTGVLEEIPDQSHLQFDVLLPAHAFEGPDRWNTFIPNYTYLLLKPNTEKSDIEKNLAKFVERRIEPELTDNEFYSLSLQPMLDIYLYSDLRREIGSVGNIQFIYILMAIGLLILGVALVNFINLLTTQYALRSREIGVRKILGARRKQIMGQYLGESILTSYISLVVSIGCIELMLPGINEFVGKQLELGFNSVSIIYVLFLPLIVGVVAGIYPAVVLSDFAPSKIFNSLKGGSLGHGTLRKGLVTFQFAISIGLIATTLIIYQQLQYINTKDLGFEKERVIFMPLSEQIVQNIDFVKNQISQNPAVEEVAASLLVPTKNNWTWGVRRKGNDLSTELGTYFVDDRFFATYDIQLRAGRYFTKSMVTDSAFQFILNESAVQTLGFQRHENAIGSRLEWGFEKEQGPVIGVVADFHVNSLYNTIQPMVFIAHPWYQYLSLKVTDVSHLEPLIASVGAIMKEVDAGYLYEYEFIDQDFAASHRRDQEMSQLFTAFSGLAIFIACLGLYSLSHLTGILRRKEIGIRKVLGASSVRIMTLFIRHYLLLILTGGAIIIPVVIIGANRWLQQFAYKTAIEVEAFAIAIGLVTLLALLTIGMQIVRAALVNPVQSIRYD